MTKEIDWKHNMKRPKLHLKTANQGKHEGKRKSGRPKNTCQQTVEIEAVAMRHTENFGTGPLAFCLIEEKGNG